MNSTLRRPLRSSEAGYSLSEILVVVAIIGVLSLVTVPNFIALYNGARMKSTVRGFMSTMRRARQDAIVKNIRTKVSFTTGGNGTRRYTVWRELRDPTTNATTWTRLSTQDLEQIAYFSDTGFQDEASTTATDGGANDVIFNNNGTVGNLPANDTDWFIELKTDLKVAKKVYRINFNPSGNFTLS